MKLVVCFPGIGYHCDKPLLYYGRRVAESIGYKEYKNVEYVNRIGNVKGDPVKMQAAFEDLYGQTEEILKDIDFNYIYGRICKNTDDEKAKAVIKILNT